VRSDDEVQRWYDNERPSREQAERRARFMGGSWRLHGVHKWIAYDRVSSFQTGAQQKWCRLRGIRELSPTA